MSERICLQLDVGNSSAKWRLLQGTAVLARGRYVSGDVASRRALLSIAPTPENIWVSSVAAADAELELEQLLLEQWGVRPWFARTQSRAGDLVNSYADPSRMGVDRWLAMLGARTRTKGRFCVVDAGSALTIDIVNAQGMHEGGYIIPGPHLMERALLLDTGRVRFEEDVEYALTPGTSTAAAVRHGIALAQAGAVALAAEFEKDSGTAFFVCGGGGEQLLELLSLQAQWVPDLVFEGIEAMAQLNRQED